MSMSAIVSIRFLREGNAVKQTAQTRGQLRCVQKKRDHMFFFLINLLQNYKTRAIMLKFGAQFPE